MASAVAAAAPALADDPDVAAYCAGNGGPAGIATDAEHNVLVGDPPLPARARQSRVVVGGVATRVIQAGPRSASVAVVFLHGNPGSSRDFDDLLSHAGRFTRAVAFDIPGWGKSDKLAHPERQTSDGAAAYIQGVLDKLGIRRVVLVAHDFGGIWGLQWAAKHPAELVGVTLIDTGVLKDYTPHPAAVVWATPGAGEAQLASTTRESFRQSINNGQPRPLPNRFVDRMYDDYDRPERCALIRYYRSVGEATLVDSNALANYQGAALRGSRRPALVIWGEHDPYIPVEQAYKQRDVFKGARVKVFSDAAHFPYVDDPGRTRAAVVPFLRPRLSARALRARAGSRRLRVRVAVRGMFPAYAVRVRSRARRSRSLAIKPGTSRTLTIRLRRPLRPGVRRVVVRAHGLPARHLRVRVRRQPRPTARTGVTQGPR